MTGLVLALGALAVVAEPGPRGVRLAPFHCLDVSDSEVLPLLRVEIRERLIDGGAPTTGDFTLVSVSCDGEDANVLAVRQGGGAPLRRRVPFGGTAVEARSRHVAVAVAELLRGEPASPPPPAAPPPPATAPPAQVTDRDDLEPGSSYVATLDLAEPLIMSPLGSGRRAGARTRFGHTEVPAGQESPNFYVLSIEPFVDFALGKDVVATLTLPLTWTDGPGSDLGGGGLANLTGGLRYASGDQLRVGVGAAVSLNVGQAAPAQAESNRFELDRFRDGTYSLRLQADALWRSGRLYLQAELAVLVLLDEHVIGTLLRPGVSGGIAFDTFALGVEYVVVSDVLEDYFAADDRFFQALILGARWPLSAATTMGLHCQFALDQTPNLGFAGTLSVARSF